MDPIKVYDYLTNARARVFDAVRPLRPEQYAQPFGFGLRTISATLTHTMVSEWYYIQRIEGRAVPPYAQWPVKDENPPAFPVLEATWREQARGTRAALAAERDWGRRIEWESFPDEQGRRFRNAAAAGDFVTQLALHEVHHRAQVMAMLRELGSGPPLEDLDYNSLMFERSQIV